MWIKEWKGNPASGEMNESDYKVARKKQKTVAEQSRAVEALKSWGIREDI
jgi:hypothetical protein